MSAMTFWAAIVSVFIALLGIAARIFIYTHSIRQGKLMIESADSANDSWEIRSFDVKEFKDGLSKAWRRYKRIKSIKKLPGDDNVTPTTTTLGDFLDISEHNNRLKKASIYYSTHKNEHYPKYHSFSGVWFNFGIYWKSEKAIIRALKECKRILPYEVVSIPKPAKEGWPTIAPCHIDLRFRNVGMKSIHITSLIAETVAICQGGAGSGSFLLPATEKPIVIPVSKTKDISKVQTALEIESDSHLRLLVEFSIPDGGYGDGEASFLVRLSCEYNDNQTTLLRYFYFL